MFFGTECQHCEKMEALVKKLETEKKLKVERKEVWHDEANMRELEDTDRDMCGGVPFFYNTENKKWLCGEAEYDELLDWVK